MATINEQLTQLASDRDDFVDNLEAKGITGLTGDETITELVPEILNISVLELPQYDSTYITGTEGTGMQTYNCPTFTSVVTTGNTSFGKVPVNDRKGLCFFFTRSTYTYGSDLTYIAETERCVFDSVNQNIVAFWTDKLGSSSANLSVTQAQSNRMAAVSIMIKNGKPTMTPILNQVFNTSGTSSITVNPTDNICVYAITTAYGMNMYDYPDVNATSFNYATIVSARLAVFISTDSKQKTLPLPSGTGCAILGIEVTYD